MTKPFQSPYCSSLEPLQCNLCSGKVDGILVMLDDRAPLKKLNN